MSERQERKQLTAHEQHLAEFYNNLHRESVSYYDIYSALDTYISDEFQLESQCLGFEQMVEGGLCPTQETYERSLDEAMEQSMLVPLKLILPYLELKYSDNPAVLEAWLRKSVGWALKQTGHMHTPEECLAVLNQHHPVACGESQQCPIKVIRDILTAPLRPMSSDVDLLRSGDTQLLFNCMRVRTKIALKYNLVFDNEVEGMLARSGNADSLLAE